MSPKYVQTDEEIRTWIRSFQLPVLSFLCYWEERESAQRAGGTRAIWKHKFSAVSREKKEGESGSYADLGFRRFGDIFSPMGRR